MKRNKLKFKNGSKKKCFNYTWIFTVIIATFLLAMFWEYSSQLFLSKRSFLFSSCILLSIVLVGVFFDLLGIALTAAREKPFHAMASKKVRGAKESIGLIRNASSVANFFNDVIGDIAGILSGTAGITILIRMSQQYDLNTTLLGILLTGIIASLTVGGKAVGKEIALRHSNLIVFKMGYILSVFSEKQKNNQSLI